MQVFVPNLQKSFEVGHIVGQKLAQLVVECAQIGRFATDFVQFENAVKTLRQFVNW